MLAILAGLGWLVSGAVRDRQYFQQAKAAFENDRCPEAFEYFKAYLERRPHDRAAMFWTARAARRVDEFDLAAGLLKQCKDEPALGEAFHREQLLLRANRGELDEVFAECQQLLRENHPDESLVREAIIKGLLLVLRPDEARAQVAEWLKRHPDHPQAIFLDALIDQLGSPLQVQATKLRRVVKLDPLRADARRMLAELLLEMGLGGEALSHLERLRAERPNDLSIPTRMANALDLLGRQAEAVALVDAVLSQQPASPQALLTRGKLALRGGELATAESFLTKACGKMPGSLAAHHQLVQCLRQRGKITEAKAVDQRIREIRDDSARLRAIIARDLPASPRSAPLHAELGRLFYRLGATNDALRWFRSAVRIDPNRIDAHQALAEHFERAGQFELAATHRQAILQRER
jgi:tetratricopeptide (TPR) repeat protein